MRLAAFNVENLFDRVRAFNDPDPDTHRSVLDQFSELNALFEQPHYGAEVKQRMLELLEALGLLRVDEGVYVHLRRVRGKLLVRPRRGPVRIVAGGRGDWVGWCELKTSRVEEEAILMTARVIRDVSADIMALVEIESRPVLKGFHDFILKPLPAEPYRHMMVIDGNDDRGIDVGILAREGFALPAMRSHVDETEGGRPVFSRDCPEYTLITPGGEPIVVLPNHFKSKFGGNAAPSRARRRLQARFVAQYYRRLRSEGVRNIAVLGDLNDTPDSEELAPLMETDLREVTDHPGFTEVEFNVSNGQRGIGTYATGADSHKLDYILLSPDLWAKVVRGGIFRKGAWSASRRWEMYPELTRPVFAASDHHCIWVDLDLA